MRRKNQKTRSKTEKRKLKSERASRSTPLEEDRRKISKVNQGKQTLLVKTPTKERREDREKPTKKKRNKSQ